MPFPAEKPSCFLFDYGETLGHEDDFLPVPGFSAMLEHAVSNPEGLDGESLCNSFAACFRELRRSASEIGAELPNQARWKWLFEMHSLEFSLPTEELEMVFWNATAPCIPTPGMAQLLALLRKNGIPTGVVSNMGFTGASLRRRLEGLYPDHRFDLVITSADYLLMKPNPHLFSLALKKIGHTPEESWFAGDNIRADIAGAQATGMTAVFYDRDLGCAYRAKQTDEIPLGTLRISDWSELYDFFKS